MGIAIVGGGVAGCYSAYRLAQANAGSTDIYEASDRVGGRLWSVRLEGAAPIELGGAFFSTLQANVYGLVTQELRLPCTPVNWSRDRLFFRGAHLSDKSFDEPACVPFRLEGAEAGRNAPAVLAYVLGRIVPGFTGLWPFDPTGSSCATYAHLQSLRHKGRPLTQCGFWNVLSEAASNEAYQLLTYAIGSVGVFRNANAFDAIWNLLQEIAPQDFYRIDAGYQSLAQSLWDASGKNVGRHLGHRLTRIDRAGDGFVLFFDTAQGVTQESASHVILALPQRALQRIAFGNGVLDDLETFAQLRDSVHPMPACKLFLTFDAPWWPDPSRDPAAVVASFTDLPMQQCYCFGGADGGPALIMASLADDASVSFWRTLSDVTLPLHRHPVPGAPAALRCSAPMVESALRQLSLLYGVDAPAPSGAVFVNWEADRFGAGWHAWSAGVRSWEVRKQIRSPAKRLYVCGEAYAERHGWVEGALNSAEMVVQHLGVGRPSWVDRSYVFEQEEGECAMTGQVSELLVALGESSALKRVYDRDPGGVMSAFGLSADAQVAMRSNDLSLVKSAAGVRECAFIIAKPAN